MSCRVLSLPFCAVLLNVANTNFEFPAWPYWEDLEFQRQCFDEQRDAIATERDQTHLIVRSALR